MTVIKAVLIPADEEKAIELVEFEQGSLDAMQRHVGGYIEMVSGQEPDLTFVINEDGKNVGLDLNRRATLALWIWAPMFTGQDFFVGDVLVMGPADEETGNTLGVPDELIDLFFNTAEYRYMVKVINEDGWHGNGRRYDNWTDAANGGFSLAKRWTLVNGVKVCAA